MGSINQIFGLASATSYVRCGGSGYNTQIVLASLADAFGGNTGDGIYVYNQFINNTGGFSISGLNAGSDYVNTLENKITGLGNYSTIGVASIIYSYANFSNIEEALIVSFVNNYCQNISNFLGENYNYYPQSEIDVVLNNFNLSSINQQISTAPRNTIGKIINYNWYDASNLFINPDFDDTLIRDVENQYYYVSGSLIYDDFVNNIEPCIKYYQTISTSTGNIQATILANIPCYDTSSYIGPLSGLTFYREFTDGPGTLGEFTQPVINEYITFDESVLEVNDYSNNSVILYSRFKDVNGLYLFLDSGVQIDSKGFYSPSNEYGIEHTNFWNEDCTGHSTWPLMRMHQGDNEPKYWFYSYIASDGVTCVENTGIYNWTGWKFANIQLDATYTKYFKDIQTNPILDTGRVLKRALNLDNSPDSPYLNVFDSGDGILTCYGISTVPDNIGITGIYVGPPQLNGTSTLPGFVFWQTFDNYNFPPASGDYARVVLRAAISNNDRSLTIGTLDLASGIDNTHHLVNISDKERANAEFYNIISSWEISDYDSTTKSCLSIGDNFQNQISGESTTFQSNAGYLYTGYTYIQNGNIVNLSQLLGDNVEIVGGQYSQLKYIQGYLSGLASFYVSNQYAYIITGNTSTGINYEGELIYYSYFNNGILGAQNYGWQVFAPLPPAVISNTTNFKEIYAIQPVENYFPRYSSGPYRSYNVNFLYPNANVISDVYDSNVNGFPYQVNYKISIKEETVREFFMTSGLNNAINYTNIVRVNTGNQQITYDTLMVSPFVPNNTLYTSTFNWFINQNLYPESGQFFNSVNTTSGYVNANYIPSRDYCPQPNLNSVIYQNNNLFFNQGIKYTGQLIARNIHGKSGDSQIIVSEPIGGGLYWGYNSLSFTGSMLYTPPLFDLSTYTLNPTLALYKDMVSNVSSPTNSTFTNNGSIRYGTLFGNSGYNGNDPIFYQPVGGRSGYGANLEGGYNSSGIIGDAWYNLNLQNWGYSTASCYRGEGIEYSQLRNPNEDKYLLLMDLTSGNLNIFTRALSYYPYYLNWHYQPFEEELGYDIGVNVTSRLTNGQYYFDFNLNNFNTLMNGNINGLYSSSGLNIGPFDRDVELCLTGNNSIIPSGVFVVDGEIMADSTANGEGCPINYVENFQLNSGIIRGQAGREGLLTTFKLIPSGNICNINISGNQGLLGLLKPVTVTIRPRTCLGAVQYGNTNLMSGDISIMNNFNYIVNGTESQFNIPIPYQTFESLVGSNITIITTPRIEILYPIPYSDFDTILNPTFDSYGNKYYSQPNPTLYYWQQKLPRTSSFLGVREVSRIYISIDQVSTEKSTIPYQSYLNVIPSGSCIISGNMAYISESESAIITEGIILSGTSGAASLTGIFTPTYVSDTLLRLPSNIYQLPLGVGISPTLSAPSLMKIRKNYPAISGDDIYVTDYPIGSGNYYNAFLWPAWSDFGLLNPELSYEEMPPDDGNVFLGSYLTFSASQGQNVGTGFNPIENVTYEVLNNFTFLDSISTNALLNPKCIISGLPSQTTLMQSGNLSGILTSQGSSLTLAVNLMQTGI